MHPRKQPFFFEPSLRNKRISGFGPWMGGSCLPYQSYSINQRGIIVKNKLHGQGKIMTGG
jgi:hypothetical protein